MTAPAPPAGNPHKRPRLASDDATDIRLKRSVFLSSLSRTVSPPNTATPDHSTSLPTQTHPSQPTTIQASPNATSNNSERPAVPRLRPGSTTNRVASPFQLTKVLGLPPSTNVDTVSLHDILGDPLIKEVWMFNFCFNVDWIMTHFDEDVRELVNVKIVHGSWRREDSNKIGIEEDVKKWKNVEEIKAYLPDQFGTHHSKMMILFKHDDTAQVVIHTANMLDVDWNYMTQAVWRSPTLPLKPHNQLENTRPSDVGEAFKVDLLRYLKAYGGRLKPLIENMARFDFSQVRAALVASVPSYTKVSDLSDKAWGHLALSRALDTMREKKTRSLSTSSHLISQVSSIATLPQAWLIQTIYKAAQCKSNSITFPTPTDMRDAITGYATGGSIHTKVSSPTHKKQVASLHPQLCRWGTRSPSVATQAKRNLVPPHIKTYISFTSKPTSTTPTPDIEWALLTSANLSTQAWGTAPKIPKGSRDSTQGVVHIQSFEIGVLVWPELFVDEDNISQKVRMVPTFGKDTPDNDLTDDESQIVVGLRMPYDLPLTSYDPGEMPWSPSIEHTEPDRLGRTWPNQS